MVFFKRSKAQTLEFPQDITIKERVYPIEVVFAKKRSSSVTVKDNEKLIFRLSSSLSQRKAMEHFSDLLKKIHKKIEKAPKQQKVITIKDVLEKMQFCFADEIYDLEYNMRVRGVRFIEGKFHINPKTKPEIVEKYLIKYLILIYEDRLKNYIKRLNLETYNFDIKGINVKYVHSKWGHCTPDNKIMINLKLLNAPIDVLDYVIIHELAHIKHKNHSKTYWREVEKFCHNYKITRKELKDNPPLLFKEI